MGRLTTHVLDTAHGCPAAGMALALFAAGAAGAADALLIETRTNDDGRCDGPLLEGARFAPGRYRLVFQAGAYYRALGVTLPEPAFLDAVEIAFGIAEPGQHYHVPLLISPYGYSTYRGS